MQWKSNVSVPEILENAIVTKQQKYASDTCMFLLIILGHKPLPHNFVVEYALVYFDQA